MYSHDGKRLTSAGNDGVRVWDAQTGQQIYDFAGPGHRPVFSVACSPNDQRIVYGEDITVKLKVLSAESGGRSFRGHSYDQGESYPARTVPGRLRWRRHQGDSLDIGSDRPALTYRGHGLCFVCRIQPRRRLIASGDQSHLVRIWSARN